MGVGMNIVSKVRSESVEVVVTGTIKTVANTQAIKDAILTAHMDHPDIPIHLNLQDSFIITSSLIGFLIKVIKMDKYTLILNVGSPELYEMLEDMNLIEIMNVRKAYR
jgi:hypothetical protein